MASRIFNYKADIAIIKDFVSMQSKMRIAKFIANAGYCSRREHLKNLLKNRLVKINNNLCLHIQVIQ